MSYYSGRLMRPLRGWRSAPLAAAVLAALAGATDPADAQAVEAGQPIRLGAVYQELRAASPRLVAADALAAAARARIPSAGLPPDPQLQLGLMNYSLPGLAPMDNLGMQQLQVMQMLPIGGKLGLSKGIARSRASAQQERASEAWWESRAQAAMAFYELHQADEGLAVMRETLRLLDDIRRTAEAMYRVGEGRQTDVLRAQVEIARMTEDTLRMQSMRSAAAARLNAQLNRTQSVSVGSPRLPAFPAEVPALDSLERAAYASRPMLNAAADELEAASQMSRLARRELIPDLQVGVQLARGTTTMTEIDGMGVPMIERRTEQMGSLMIGASIPIFARSRQFKMREEAEAMRQMASADLLAMRADTRGRLGVSYAELNRARRLTTLYRTTIIPQAQATVSSSLSAYRVGQVDFMTLLDNQMTVNKYRQELAVLEAEEGTAWAELEMLVGRQLLDPDTVAGAPAAGGAR
jgi:cobalt-zinc-cadmium efflux system outer membrane protein